MMRQLHLLVALTATAVLFLPLCVFAQNLDSTECSSMTAMGSLNNGDRFAGKFSSLSNGQINGEWLHQTPKGDHFHMNKMDWIVTPVAAPEGQADSRPHAEFAKFGGRGTWNRI
jgi:hypothetical protein